LAECFGTGSYCEMGDYHIPPTGYESCDDGETMIFWAIDTHPFWSLIFFVVGLANIPSGNCDSFPTCDYFLWVHPEDIYHEANDNYYQCWLGN